jgi:hypothetical protein
MFDFSEAENFIYKNKASIKRFTDEFLGDNNHLLSVGWNSCQMIIGYVDEDGKLQTTSYTIRLWNEFFEEGR